MRCVIETRPGARTSILHRREGVIGGRLLGHWLGTSFIPLTARKYRQGIDWNPLPNASSLHSWPVRLSSHPISPVPPSPSMSIPSRRKTTTHLCDDCVTAMRLDEVGDGTRRGRVEVVSPCTHALAQGREAEYCSRWDGPMKWATFVWS